MNAYVIREPRVPRRVLELARRSDRFSGRELAALEQGLAELAVHDGRLRVVPVVAGGAIGTGAVYERNLPAPGTFIVDPLQFAARTSKNRKSNPPVTHPGYSSSWSQRIDAVGIVSRLLIYGEFSSTPGATTPTALREYPWNLLKRIRVSANGINNLFNCEGLDLRALMRARRPYPWTDPVSVFTLPTGGGGAVTIKLLWEVPLAYDESLVGAIFAQTEETYLNVEVDTAAQADLYSANAPTAFTGTWRILTEFFSIPLVDSKAGRKLVLPDITQLHGVVTRDDQLTGTGEHIVPLTRTGGILLRTMQRIDNADAGSFDYAADLDSHAFRYGGNVEPLRYNPSEYLLWQIGSDYGDQVLPAADALASLRPGYLLDDHVRASALRDAVHMLGITEAQLVNNIRTGATINSGANVHTVQEAMVAS